MAKILIVEDDDVVSDLLASLLADQRHVVEQATNGRDGLDRIKTYAYDLVILDWHLPELTGIEVCRQLRSKGGVPVLMLTSRSQIEDKEVAFTAGADDYMVKPVRAFEFLARVRALLRRAESDDTQELRFKDIALNPSSGKCSKGDSQISLPLRESELLALLMTNSANFLSTETIIARLWGDNGSKASLANCIKRLRQKLAELGEIDLIITQPGVGYRLS